MINYLSFKETINFFAQMLNKIGFQLVEQVDYPSKNLFYYLKEHSSWFRSRYALSINLINPKFRHKIELIHHRIPNKPKNIIKWLIHILKLVIISLVNFLAKICLILYAILRYCLDWEGLFFDYYHKLKWQSDFDENRNIKNQSAYTIILIRHGESAWNYVFAVKSIKLFFSRFIKVLFLELLSLFNYNSSLIDAPLTRGGCAQADDLNNFIITNTSQDELLIKLKDYDNAEIAYFTSPLRRAIVTALRAFRHIFEHSVTDMNLSKKLLVLTDLQEHSGNIDCLSYSLWGNDLPLDLLDNNNRIQNLAKESLDWRLCEGNRRIFKHLTNRFDDLIRLFDNLHETQNKKVFVITGHSLFIKQFIKYYTDPYEKTAFTTKKIANCSALSFIMKKSVYVNHKSHKIDTSTLKFVYGKFA